MSPQIMENKTTYVLAPLAGYTDLPFRRMCWKQGMDQAYTALIDAGALIFGNPENYVSSGFKCCLGSL